MKTIEEKAKAYDEAMNELRDFHDNYNEISRLVDFKQELERIFPELKESEDERIRKQLIEHTKWSYDEQEISEEEKERWISWLKKQGEHKKFRDSIQVGDKVTKNEDGVLVNLSQLDRVAKKDEQILANFAKTCKDEQKPADKVEPKFKIGDFIVNDYCMGRIVEITNDAYLLDTEQGIPFSCHSTRLWDVTKDAKAGDVLASKDKLSILIFKNLDTSTSFSSYYNIAGKGELGWLNECFIPATKEQRDTLMKAMADAGYTFDFEKKELKKIEQRPAWSEEDGSWFKELELMALSFSNDDSYRKKFFDWLKSLKDRVQPQNRWKPDKAVIQILELIIQGKANPTNYQATLMNLVEQLKKLKG